jgi:ADP-heptose:LPS heptosyltransferase
MNRWLIVRNGAIGDTILLSSLIQIIRKSFPTAYIEVMGIYERVSLLVGENGANNAVSSEDYPLMELYSDEMILSNRLKDYLTSFDVLLFFTSHKHELLKKRLQITDTMHVRVNAALPTESIHCTEHYANALSGLISNYEIPIPVIKISRENRKHAQNFLHENHIQYPNDQIISIHVGAGSKTKQAPLDFFLYSRQNICQNKNSVTCLTEGPADQEIVNQFVQRLPSTERIIRLSQKPLVEVAAILQQSTIMIGNDSGITHLAAAVGCPTIAVFVNSDPRIWAPMGSHVKIVEL